MVAALRQSHACRRIFILTAYAEPASPFVPLPAALSTSSTNR